MDQQELRATEARCIQESPPPCVTACPIHVDVRGMAAAMARGDLAGALKVLKKTLPFPRIIGRVCDQPCRADCNRKEIGEAINIAALERACADLGTDTRIATLPSRGKRVAIAGGGLSGVTAAFDLARKGWSVTVFEASDRLGGRLWAFPQAVLPPDVIRADLSVVEALGVRVRHRTAVGADLPLEQLRAEFDAVYVAVGATAEEGLGLPLDEAGRIEVDPLTYATGQDGVFAGGSLLRDPGAYSPIMSISDGRRGATSIDRYLQGASLTATRQNEGSYPSRLYTNIAGVESRAAVPMSDPGAGYSHDEAVLEAQRCLLCECLECVKVCEYLAHYRSHPKRYVREIYNNLSIVAGQRHSNQFINSCSLCGLCATVCPTDLNMATICRQARQTMVEQRRMPPSAHDFALRDMAFSTGEKFALVRHEPGTTGSEYLFFPGCQLAGSAPEQVEAVYGYLRERLSGGVGLALGCCGAPADWAGREVLCQEVIDDLSARFQEMGSPRLILACSSCHQVFKAHLPQYELISLWELFSSLGLPDRAVAPAGGRLALHDPCTTRGERAMQDSVRRLLARMGYEVEELPLSREKTECCSYGGLMWFANRELARRVVERRIEASPADYVTYCATCRDFFAARGKRTLHLLDLILAGDLDERATRPDPGYSWRHENRARLKRGLLKRVWGEEMPDHAAYEDIRLQIPPDVRALLEERLILVEDIQQVIEFAERTQARFIDPETGHYLASHRPASVTYWVEYSLQNEGYLIHNAYSHRMQVGKGNGQ
ncbi:MAG: FAD-dependent oxidoreductase [Anaerolineaceae bacterium]|nr:FAD-dependent oxidoreductase [Anaerolineaceae bacterium]